LTDAKILRLYILKIAKTKDETNKRSYYTFDH